MKRNIKIYGITFTGVLVFLIIINIANGWHIMIENANIQINYSKEAFASNTLKVKITGNLFCKTGIEIPTKQETPNEITALGVHKLNYSYQLFGKKRIVEQTLDVRDIEPPELILHSKEGYYTKYQEAYMEEGYVATDNFDGNLTGKVKVTMDKEKVYYSVTDSSGNTTEVCREIPYADRTPPVITLIGDSETKIYVNTEYEEFGAIAIDDLDGDITNKMEIENNIDITRVGTYDVIYHVKDSHDNEAAITRSVIVKEIDNAYMEKELGKVIYLTFDDGPGPYTKELLDILDEYNVKATFFVCNTDYIDLIKEEYDRGHSIAIHAYEHNYRKLYKSVDAFYEDLNKMSDIIYEQIGIRTKLLRFPGGSSMKKEILNTLVNDVREKGYQYFDWNVSSGDGAATGTASDVYDLVTQRCAKHKVNVVLQHDIKKWSVDAVEDIIKWGLANGYTFLPLDETSFPAHHRE